MGNKGLEGAAGAGGFGEGDARLTNEQLIKKTRAGAPDQALKNVMFKSRKDAPNNRNDFRGPDRHINYNKPP